MGKQIVSPKVAKEIETLNSNMGKQIKQIAYTNSASVTFSLANNSRYLFIETTSGVASQGFVALLSATTAGVVAYATLFKGDDVSVSTATGKITLTFPDAGNRHYLCVSLNEADLMTLD